MASNGKSNPEYLMNRDWDIDEFFMALALEGFAKLKGEMEE